MPSRTIGLLITDLTRTWTIQQWAGVRHAARKRGANLVTFDGRHLRSPYGYNSQANVLYQLASSERIDGLVVWTEGLISYLSQAEGKAFLSRYNGMPVVSVEHEVEGFPNVLNDDFGSMRSVLCHLIQDHGYRRVAYLRHATPSHHGFDERYRGYRETLAEHGIPFDPALVSPPIEAESPPAAFILADWMQRERASEWDAIVCHNDLSAFHALRDIQSLGMRLTRLPAITGFDDSEEGLLMDPPLTTVRPPFWEMAVAAVELVLDLLQGKSTETRKTLPGKLLVRRSCGCADAPQDTPVHEDGRRQRRIAMETRKREAALRNAQASLFSKFSVPGLMDELSGALPGLGIPRCSVSLYEDPAPYSYPDDAPQRSRLALSLGPRGRLDAGDGGVPFPSRLLAPAEAWPSEEPFELVAEALYFQDHQLGFALFGVGPEQGEVYESLRAVISNDLQGARLVEQERARVRELRDSEQERRQLESMLHQAQKLEAVGQLAGGVAHEFNNILTGIMGFSSILLMDMAPEDSRRALVERILTASRNAADLAQRMLILSQKNTARPAPIDLNGTALSSTATLSALLGETIRLSVEPWKEPLPVLADEMRIHQVLVSLAENARDAMKDGGTVVIRLSAEEIGEHGRPPGFQPGTYARIEFSDTGSGMDELTRARLFEPFFTTKDIGKGTGLGLAIVWAIIEQHQGLITVASKPGQGTTFEILLPMRRTLGSPEEPQGPVQSLRGNETILIVDDDKATREEIRSALEENGYHVVEAEDGEEAIRGFRQRAGRIHLALLDTMMAKVDGWEVAQEIRRQSPEVKIIFTSEYGPSRFGNEPLHVDDSRLLLKPFTAFQLVEKVRAVLDE